MSRFLILVFMAFSLFTYASSNPGEVNIITEKVENAEFENITLQSGLYISHNQEENPTFFIDKEELKWGTTFNIATSYAINGKIFATKEGFVAYTQDGKIVIHFEVSPGNEFKIVSVENDDSKPEFWLKEGMVFQAAHLNSVYPEFMDVIMMPNDALAKAKEADVIVFEDGVLTSGRSMMQSFYEFTRHKHINSVLCAYYYSKDQNTSEKEEDININYPELYFNEIVFDGKVYRLKHKLSTLPEVMDESYPFLLHFEGEAPESADYTYYNYYVLCEREDVTWEDILKSQLSSQTGASIKYELVYQEHRK